MRRALRLAAGAGLALGSLPAQQDDAATRAIDYGLHWGGQARLVVQAANYDRHSLTIGGAQRSVNFAALRLRPWVDVVHREGDHGVYVQTEIGHVFLGEDREFPKLFGNDDVGLELRRGFLWYRPDGDSLLRVGVLDWQDRFAERPGEVGVVDRVDAYDTTMAMLANSVWDFDVGGVTFEDRAGAWRYRLALVLLGKGDRTLTGSSSATLVGVDVDRQVDSALVGASVYWLRDHGGYSYGAFGGPKAAYDDSFDVWFGVRGHLDLGDVRPSLMVIGNHGETHSPGWRHTGFAARAMAEVDLDDEGTTLRVQVLHTSGDDGGDPKESAEFRTIAQSERDDLGGQGYWSLLAITSPRGPTDVNDLGIGPQNRGLGLFTVQAALERDLAPALRGQLALGWLRSAEKNPASGSADIGFEAVAEVRWAISGSLGLDVGVAGLLAGDFFRAAGGGDPDPLYTAYMRMQLEL